MISLRSKNEGARWPPLTWVTPVAGVGLDFDFQNGRYYQTGQGNSPASLLTVARASAAYEDDSAGNWTLFGNNVLRVTDKGALIEEARTNSIRNNSMQGAVPGTPGTLPTNWSETHTTTITPAVIGTGVENGIDYIDIQLVGTATAGNNSIFLEANSLIAALYGQTWTQSIFVRIVGGSLTNITNTILILGQRNAGGGSIGDLQTIITPTGVRQRFTNTATLNNSATAFVQPLLQVNPAGGAINLTLRIGWPQAENNNINSSVASATVAAGGAGGVSGAAVYLVGGGTGTAATLNVTVAGGAITAINSVASAGSYTVFPPSPAALTYVSGVGSGVVGATANLVLVDNSAVGFATSPIRTTAAAATRVVDVVTVTTSPTFGAAYTLFTKGTPNAPVGYPPSQNIIQPDLAVGNDLQRTIIRRRMTAGILTTTVGGSAGQNSPAGIWAQFTSGKIAFALAPNDQASTFNGGAIAASAAVSLPTTPTEVRIGINGGGGELFNGYVERITVWPTTRVPDATLQSLTT